MSEEIFPNEQLRRARSLKGWSQEKLAEEVGTVSTIVSRWERGINVPSPYFRERLCAVLGKTAEELRLLPSSQKPSPLPEQEKPSLADLSQGAEDEQETTPVMALRPVMPSQISSKPPPPSVAQRNRERLRRRVHAFWITGVLERSLHGAALIALGLQEQPDAVAHPWHLVLQQPEMAPRLLPTGMRIIDVYDVSDGELLILGAPGSGKTTQLLELARDLLSRAAHDESHPLPVIFNLSSWATKRQCLVEWLVEELNTRYQVPRKLGRTLVEQDQILPLLDGLDEVATTECTACIEAINTYREEHGLSSLVVCSRSTDYLAQATRMRLDCAVEIQPLTDQQIDDYLASAGKRLEALRLALHQDASLREITDTPLMLSMLTLTYLDSPVEDLSRTPSPTDRQQQVFEHYIERMLRHRETPTSYPSQHTRGWLAWLARQMKQHGQTVFYIERMQPDWLPEFWLHRLYYRAVVRLGIGIVSGLMMYLTIGIAIGLFIGTSKEPGIALVSGLVVGLVSALAGGLVMALTSRIEREIQPAEVVVWSWRRLIQLGSFKKRVIVGISSGLTLGLLMGLALVVLGSSGVDASIVFQVLLTLALVVVVIILLTGRLTSGVSTTLHDERDLTQPNQGIRQSVRNSIRIGVIGALVGGSISIGAFFLILTLIGAKFSGGFVNELCFLLLCGAVGGTISGLIVGLSNGGIASIQHLVLRVLLWRSHFIPWNYPRFLDHATEHILLRKVGGGYMFIHGLLAHHFASRETGLPTDEASGIHPSEP